VSKEHSDIWESGRRDKHFFPRRGAVDNNMRDMRSLADFRGEEGGLLESRQRRVSFVKEST